MIKSQWDTIYFSSFSQAGILNIRSVSSWNSFKSVKGRSRRVWWEKHPIFHFRGKGGNRASTPLWSVTGPCVLYNLKRDMGKRSQWLTWSEQEHATSKRVFTWICRLPWLVLQNEADLNRWRERSCHSASYCGLHCFPNSRSGIPLQPTTVTKGLLLVPFSFLLLLLPSFLWFAPATPCNSHNCFWEAEMGGGEKPKDIIFYFARISQWPLPCLALGAPLSYPVCWWKKEAAPHLRTQHDGAFPFQDSFLPFSITRDPEPVHF